MNEALLQAVAKNSGGTYYRAADMAGLYDDLDIQERTRASTVDIILWDHPALLLALLILLGIEWTMRKRRGLA